MPSPSSMICSEIESRSPHAPDRYRGAGGRIFRGIVQQVEQHLLEQHRVEFQHRQVGGKIKRDLVSRQHLAGAPQRAADDLADILPRRIRHDRAGFQLGHVEQIGDEAVEPLGLVDHGGEQIALFGVGQGRWRDRAACGGAEHRGERRLEIVRDRGQQRRAQPVRLHGALDAIHVLDQLHPLDRQRALVDQRIEQPALVRRQQRSGSCRRRCRSTPIGPRPVRIGRNSRLAPGSVSEPRPAGRSLPHAQFAAARSALSS